MFGKSRSSKTSKTSKTNKKTKSKASKVKKVKSKVVAKGFTRVVTSSFSSITRNGKVESEGQKIVSDSRSPKASIIKYKNGKFVEKKVPHKEIYSKIKSSANSSPKPKSSKKKSSKKKGRK